MRKPSVPRLDFVIDKLTNSIENVHSGDRFITEISLLTRTELKKITKKNGWRFDWAAEYKDSTKQVYKLTISNNPTIVQGLVSLEVRADHLFMHLIESAPFNIGRMKTYFGVPGNLVAYACKLSFQNGYQGYVSFIAKTKLIAHYQETLNATHFGGNLMVITTKAAVTLIDKYFQEK